MPRYWLFKSEPGCYSIDDLQRDHTTFWDGVRNYQARNMLRDEVQAGDQVFFYHSNADPLAIVGVMQVVRAGYPDHTQFDPEAQHFDPDATEEAPTWYMVDVSFIKKFARPATRALLQARPALSKMELLRKGSRLSIQPVTSAEWAAVHELVDESPSIPAQAGTQPKSNKPVGAKKKRS